MKKLIEKIKGFMKPKRTRIIVLIAAVVVVFALASLAFAAVGGLTQVCPSCGASFPAGGTCNCAAVCKHTSTYNYYVYPTCTENGYVLVLCKACDYQVGSRTKGYEATGHSWSSTGSDTESTCTSSTTVTYYECSSCGETKSETTTGSGSGHNWVDASYSAGCTSPGWSGKECTRCGETTGSPTPPLEHDWETNWYGCDWVEECANCGACGDRGTSHDPERTRWYGCYWEDYCPGCGEVFDSGESHSIEYYDDGCYWEEYCSDCFEVFDYGGSHNYAAATCEKPKTCTKCGATTGTKLGHISSYSYSKTDGTNHLVTVTCSRSGCGVTLNTYSEAHTLTATGYTGNNDGDSHVTAYKCNNCTHTENKTEACSFSSGKCSKCSQGIHYTIVYNANGGTGTTASSSHVYGTAKVLTSNGFSKEGYNFLGWATSATATAAKYTNGQSVSNLTTTKDGTVTLYAVWKANTYTVTFNGNGATGGSMNKQTHTYGKSLALTTNAFTRTNPNYTFLGWSTSADGEVEYTNGQSVSNLTAVNGGNINLYAVWKVNNVCTITTNPTAQTETYGTAITLTAAAKGIDQTGPDHVMSYQWQSSTNNSTWTNIAGATTATYVVPAGQNAGTYYYRMVATCTIPSFEGVYSDVSVSATSASAKVIINKTTGILTATASNSGAVIVPNEKHLVSLDGGDVEFATLVINDGTVVTASSADTTKVKVSVSGDKLIVTPKGTSTSGVKITLSTATSTNYNAASLSFYVYVSDAPSINVTFSPSTLTSGDVMAIVTVSHQVNTTTFPSYSIASVKINGRSAESTGANTFTFKITENGTFTVAATDSFGSTTTKSISVDWIDKAAPNINVISNYDPTTYKFAVYIVAWDDRSGASEISYCLDYDPDAPNSATWTSTNVFYVDPGTTVNVAVKDQAGNIATEEYYVVSNGSSSGGGGNNGDGNGDGDGNGGSQSTSSVLVGVINDMSGKVFGKTGYLETTESASATNYVNGSYELSFEINSKRKDQYVAGYLEFAGLRFPVSWYADASLTEPLTTMSDDGSTNLAQGVAYGKVVIDPTVFATKTLRNATAELHVVRYSDTGMGAKVASEKYSMPCSIDVTAPSLSATYNEYSRTLSIRAKDAISGLMGDVTYTINGAAGSCGSTADFAYPTTSTDGNEFTITLKAKDKLGNEATKTYTFKPYSSTNNNGGNAGGGNAGGGTGEGGNNATSGASTIATYRTRLFDVYIVKGK